MPGVSEERFPAAAAGEEDTSEWFAAPELGAGQFEGTGEIGGGGIGVATLELEGLAGARMGSHGQSAGAGIHAEEIADEEIAGTMFIAVLGAGEPDHEIVVGAFAFVFGKPVERVHEDGVGGAIGDAEDEIPFGAGDRPRFADRGAALGDHREDADFAGEPHEYDAVVVDGSIEIHLGDVATDVARQSADGGNAGERSVPCGEPRFVVGLKRISEGDESTGPGCGAVGQFAAPCAFQPFSDDVLRQMKGVKKCARQVVQGEDEPGGQGVFIGSGESDLGGAPDEQGDACVQSEDFQKIDGVRSEGGRYENDAEGDDRCGQLCTQGSGPLGNVPLIPVSIVDVHDAVGRSHGREAIESHAVGKQPGRAFPDIQAGRSCWGEVRQGLGFGDNSGVGLSPISSATFFSMAAAQTRCPSSLGCSKSGINEAGMLPSGRRKS